MLVGQEDGDDVDAHVATVMAKVNTPRPIITPAPDRKRLVSHPTPRTRAPTTTGGR